MSHSCQVIILPKCASRCAGSSAHGDATMHLKLPGYAVQQPPHRYRRFPIQHSSRRCLRHRRRPSRRLSNSRHNSSRGLPSTPTSRHQQLPGSSMHSRPSSRGSNSSTSSTSRWHSHGSSPRRHCVQLPLRRPCPQARPQCHSTGSHQLAPCHHSCYRHTSSSSRSSSNWQQRTRPPLVPLNPRRQRLRRSQSPAARLRRQPSGRQPRTRWRPCRSSSAWRRSASGNQSLRNGRWSCSTRPPTTAGARYLPSTSECWRPAIEWQLQWSCTNMKAAPYGLRYSGRCNDRAQTVKLHAVGSCPQVAVVKKDGSRGHHMQVSSVMPCMSAMKTQYGNFQPSCGTCCQARSELETWLLASCRTTSHLKSLPGCWQLEVRWTIAIGVCTCRSMELVSEKRGHLSTVRNSGRTNRWHCTLCQQ